MRATTLTLIFALAGFMPAADNAYAQSGSSGQTTGNKPGNINQGGDNSGNNSGGASDGSASSGGSGQTQGGQPGGGNAGSGQVGGDNAGSGQAGGSGSSSGQTAGGQPGGGNGSGSGSGQGGDQPPSGGGQPPAGGGQASADMIDATDPDVLVSIMQDLGYRTTLTTDSSGDPMIESKVAGLNTTIFFYRCTDHKNCKLIQFSTAFNTGGKGSPAKMAEWNKGHMLGVASLDSDFDPVVQMTVNMFGGISKENFKDTVDWWDVVLTEFKEHIDF